MAETSRIAVTVLKVQAQRLRTVAAQYGTTAGLVTRVLISHGLTQLKDPAVIAAIKAEVDKDRERRQAVGRAAMRVRYNKEHES